MISSVLKNCSVSSSQNLAHHSTPAFAPSQQSQPFPFGAVRHRRHYRRRFLCRHSRRRRRCAALCGAWRSASGWASGCPIRFAARRGGIQSSTQLRGILHMWRSQMIGGEGMKKIVVSWSVEYIQTPWVTSPAGGPTTFWRAIRFGGLSV